MCGLVGYASFHPQPDGVWLGSARDTLRHRGPDDEGIWFSDDRRVGLAHRRLAIQDLSAAGHQPMHRPEKGLSIVFNGEIYNFKALRAELVALGVEFSSGSDTEVLLAAYEAWGDACLDRLNGAFAFALFDARRQRVLLARDRSGEKPLYYCVDQGQLCFASELKALLAHPGLSRRVDPAALDCYLSMGYVPGDLCILEGYKKLPPAHALSFTLDDASPKVWPYWCLPSCQESPPLPEEELVTRLESLLEDAVCRQMVADVPVGVLLSGGVDSSLLTAMAARRSRRVRTFTISFPGHAQWDEAPYARRIADHFSTEHTELAAEPTTADLLPTLARQFDEPMADSSMIPMWLVSQLVRPHCVVALGGDGGDELFGGYSYYSQLISQQRALARIPRWLRQGIAEGAEALLPVGLRGRNYLQRLNVDLCRGLPLGGAYFDRATRRKLMKSHPAYALVAERILAARVPRTEDLLQRATRMDFGHYLDADILTKVDRASMLNSLEIRAPFLDRHLMEFAFGSVPSHLKATASERKILLRRLAERVLPPDFDSQRKQGFSIPLAEWLRAGPFRRLFWDTLTDPGCCFDPATVQGLLRGQDRGRNNSERLFAMVLFELWRNTYGARV